MQGTAGHGNQSPPGERVGVHSISYAKYSSLGENLPPVSGYLIPEAQNAREATTIPTAVGASG